MLNLLSELEYFVSGGGNGPQIQSENFFIPKLDHKIRKIKWAKMSYCLVNFLSLCICIMNIVESLNMNFRKQKDQLIKIDIVISSNVQHFSTDDTLSSFTWHNLFFNSTKWEFNSHHYQLLCFAFYCEMSTVNCEWMNDRGKVIKVNEIIHSSIYQLKSVECSFIDAISFSCCFSVSSSSLQFAPVSHGKVQQ